jgi:divalent metal cation (Fe/Co/Zn/Cd) transporter
LAPHEGPYNHAEHRHGHREDHGHGHSHGPIDPSIKRSRAGLRAVGLSLAVLGLTALAQVGIYLATGSVALLADCSRSSSRPASPDSRQSRLVNPREPTDLLALAIAGLIGFGGNWLAALIRTRAGKRLDSPALIADGNHARADSYVSLAVVATAGFVALGLSVAHPLIGLAITAMILKITWDSWRSERGEARQLAPADSRRRPSARGG